MMPATAANILEQREKDDECERCGATGTKIVNGLCEWCAAGGTVFNQQNVDNFQLLYLVW